VKTIAIALPSSGHFDFRRKKDIMLFLLRGKEPPARGALTGSTALRDEV
jgi:hypothetical protein